MQDSQYVKTRYLDASALIKLVVLENDSQPIRDFFNSNTNFCATSLCVAEALGRIKGMWKKGKAGQNKLSINEYLDATRTLIIDSWGGRIELDDADLFNPSVHAEVEALAKKI